MEEKPAPPGVVLTDKNPDRAMGTPGLPGRPDGLQPRDRHGERPRFPSDTRLLDEAERARLLHFFANHELKSRWN